MSLGEAFVEIHADLRPFGRDLRRNVPPMVKAFERELNAVLGQVAQQHGERHGRQIGDRVGRGMQRSLLHAFRTQNPFIAIAGALGSALDDGISALPTEVKAALVIGILAALPIIGGALTGAIVAAVGAGVVVLGVLLASQFETVQERAVQFGRDVRRELVESARDFEPAVIHAMDLVESRVRSLRPMLDQLFGGSAGFLEPLVEGALDAIEQILDSITRSLGGIEPFVDELGSAFEVLGDSIGKAIEILVSSGDDGQKALRDLVALLGAAIIATALLFRFFANLHGAIRDATVRIAELAEPFSFIAVTLAHIIKLIDERANRNKAFVNTNTDAADSLESLIAATKGETDALKDYRNAIDRASDAVRDQLGLTLDWEEALDSITESIKKNGKTLDVTNEKGRENVREFGNALQIAEQRAINLVSQGKMTSEQALAQFDAQTAALRRMAVQAGLSEVQFNALFQEIIETSRLKISASEMGIDSLAGSLGEAGGAAERLLEMLQLIAHLRRTVGAGALAGVKGFSEGGMHYTPNIVRVAEAGPEVTIPLTKPARAAALLQESGLASMLGGGAPTQVLVFVGNEQLDSRTVRIVTRHSNAQSLALTQGPRRF